MLVYLILMVKDTIIYENIVRIWKYLNAALLKVQCFLE